MTLVTLIAVNAALGVAVISALLLLLGQGIRSDRRARAALTGVIGSRTSVPERLAA
jgi:hypothetical protein